MTAILVRRLPEQTIRALKQRAAQNSRSTEAEIRDILTRAVASPVALGTELAQLGRELGGVTLPRRRRSRVTPADFS